MSTHAVQMVLDMEARFGIDIPDAEVVQLRTPGQFIEYVCGKIRAQEAADAEALRVKRALLKLRPALVQQTGRPRQEILPDTPLTKLFPARRCTFRDWFALREALEGRDWPWLLPPRSVSRLSLLFGLLVGVELWAVLAHTDPLLRIGLVLAAMLVALGVWFLLIEQLLRADVLRGCFPPGTRTVKDLLAYGLAGASHQWSREEVAEAVRHVILARLGLDEGAYSENLDLDQAFAI